MDKIGKVIHTMNERADFNEEFLNAKPGKEIVRVLRADLRKILDQLEVLGKPALSAPKADTNG